MESDYDQQLSNDFLLFLELCKDPDRAFPDKAADRNIAKKWINHLCTYVANDTSEKRVKNIYMSQLCAGLVQGKLFGPFLKDPPQGRLEKIDFSALPPCPNSPMPPPACANRTIVPPCNPQPCSPQPCANQTMNMNSSQPCGQPCPPMNSTGQCQTACPPNNSPNMPAGMAGNAACPPQYGSCPPAACSPNNTTGNSTQYGNCPTPACPPQYGNGPCSPNNTTGNSTQYGNCPNNTTGNSTQYGNCPSPACPPQYGNCPPQACSPNNTNNMTGNSTQYGNCPTPECPPQYGNCPTQACSPNNTTGNSTQYGNCPTPPACSPNNTVNMTGNTTQYGNCPTPACSPGNNSTQYLGYPAAGCPPNNVCPPNNGCPPNNVCPPNMSPGMPGNTTQPGACVCPPKPCDCTCDGGCCNCNRASAGADLSSIVRPNEEDMFCDYLLKELNLPSDFLSEFDASLTSFMDKCRIKPFDSRTPIQSSSNLDVPLELQKHHHKFLPKNEETIKESPTCSVLVDNSKNIRTSTPPPDYEEMREDIGELLNAISAELRGDVEPGSNDYLERELSRYKSFVMAHADLASHLLSQSSVMKLRNCLLLSLQNDLVKLLNDNVLTQI